VESNDIPGSIVLRIRTARTREVEEEAEEEEEEEIKTRRGMQGWRVLPYIYVTACVNHCLFIIHELSPMVDSVTSYLNSGTPSTPFFNQRAKSMCPLTATMWERQG
jgi:hypothetical protein